jgi:hypothetical protein
VGGKSRKGRKKIRLQDKASVRKKRKQRKGEQDVRERMERGKTRIKTNYT